MFRTDLPSAQAKTRARSPQVVARKAAFQICKGEEATMSEMHDLNDMYLFAKVIEHGGFSAASRALGVATSKLSRRISELERQLGVHLVNRSSRSISLSDTGETFYQHCLSMVR